MEKDIARMGGGANLNIVFQKIIILSLVCNINCFCITLILFLLTKPHQKCRKNKFNYLSTRMKVFKKLTG